MARREVTVRLDEEYFFEFDERCHQLRVKKQQALESAIDLWMKQGQAKPHLVEAPAAAGVTKEEQSQVARFLDFL